jgi:predicted Zn finger-like uncharacterized protein
MSAITQCPTCNTRFKVTREQLEAHEGLVRCGRCQKVFNATQYLHDTQPNPQLDLPIESPEPILHAQSSAKIMLEADQNSSTKEIVRQGIAGQVESAEGFTAEQPITLAVPPGKSLYPSIQSKGSGSWIAGSIFLLIVLLVQAVYFFRIEIAATQPSLKPVLVSGCQVLRCTVPLPQKADLMSIESSDLEADPAQSSVISLNALLRNHASYAQAYPNLELTLTDPQDKPLARRTFVPAEYLKAFEDEKQGLAASRELSVKLNLDTTDIKPSGYRLYLFYPK